MVLLGARLPEQLGTLAYSPCHGTGGSRIMLEAGQMPLYGDQL